MSERINIDVHAMQEMNIRIKQNAKKTLHIRLLLLCFYNDNLDMMASFLICMKVFASEKFASTDVTSTQIRQIAG